MTTWTKEDEDRLKSKQIELAKLIANEVYLKNEVDEMCVRKMTVETNLRIPVKRFVVDKWMFNETQKTDTAVEKLTEWICSNRATLVPLLNKIDEAMK